MSVQLNYKVNYKLGESMEKQRFESIGKQLAQKKVKDKEQADKSPYFKIDDKDGKTKQSGFFREVE
jgi:hypothetical protein